MSRPWIATLLASTLMAGTAAAQPYGAPQYGQPSPYGQNQYGQNQYGQNQYGQGQYGQPALAEQETRIGQLEEQIRILTGRIEELTHQIQQSRQQQERAQRDFDFRLGELERGGRQTAAAEPARPDAPRPDAPRAEPPRPAPEPPRAAPTPLPASGELPPPGQARVIAPPGPGTTTQRPAAGAPPASSPPPAAPRAPEQTAAVPRPEGTLPAGAPQQQYDQAFALLAKADYAGAERALKAFLRQHPNDGLAGNAQYWLGETYYVRQDYQNAAIAFGEGFQRYPKNAKAPDNLLKLGMSLAQINKKPEACAALGRLDQSPDAPANIKDRAKRERQRLGC
ncbi:tol-pal system protein YbgF [Stella sp.]|uniref:tol-pal system protein YbgF n=1 Tax=Stella sp. TaxID=2912054 RepID=UPI0035B2A992